MLEQPFHHRPGGSSPEPRPHVERHVIDWEVSDFSDLTLRQIRALGDDIRVGCHFLNPLYTVSSPIPTPAFYRKAMWAQAGWIKLFSDTINPYSSIAFRHNCRTLGVSAKQLQVSGVMYRDGTRVPPPLWAQHARVVREPDLARITTIRRSISLPHLRSSGGQQVLAVMSRAELLRLLSSQPTAASYVTPATTLSAPSLTSTFLIEAREEEDRWHRRLHQRFGKERKALARSLDLSTRMLVFLGVLMVAGRVHLPGCWPDQEPSEAKLGQTPFRSPTVPPEFLGVEMPRSFQSPSHPAH